MGDRGPWPRCTVPCDGWRLMSTQKAAPTRVPLGISGLRLWVPLGAVHPLVTDVATQLPSANRHASPGFRKAPCGGREAEGRAGLRSGPRRACPSNRAGAPALPSPGTPTGSLGCHS